MSGTHGVFQHRSGYFFTILEEDFCEVFKAPGVNEVCRAYITSILEHLTNKQYEATGSEKELWVFMSLPEMARRMRHACSERTIHKELQGMVKDGFIEKRRAVGKATMEYKLNLKRIRKALEALPDGQSCKSATYDLANLQEPSSNSARSTLQNYKNDLANLQARIPIDIPIEETKNNNGGSVNSADAEVDAPASENVTDYTVWKVRKTEPRMPVVKGQGDGHDNNTDHLYLPAHPVYGHSHELDVEKQVVSSHSQGLSEEETVKMPAINLKGQGDDRTDHSRTGDSGVPSGFREDLPRSRGGDTPLVDETQQTISTTLPRAPAASAAPPGSVQQGAMAMTARQIKAQAERREKELWAIIEAERGTTYTARQRALHKEGIALLIADDISDEVMIKGLRSLSGFERQTFTVLKFYGWLPNLSAKEPIPKTNGKAKSGPDAYGNDYSLTALLARQQKAM